MRIVRVMFQLCTAVALSSAFAATAQAACHASGSSSVTCTVCSYNPPPYEHSLTCCTTLIEDFEIVYKDCGTLAI